MKKMIIAILMFVMLVALAGCETHTKSVSTTWGVDSYGNRYTIVSTYIDDVLVSTEYK